MYKLQQTGNQVLAIWTPANKQITLKEKAKAMARQAVQPPTKLKDQTLSAKATVPCLAKQKHQRKPIEKVGEYTRKLDTALPGKHTRLLYNGLKRTEADILVQLRTGMSRLNRHLHRIMPLTRTYVPVARLRRQWNISYFAVPAGTNIERQCYDIRPQKRGAYHTF